MAKEEISSTMESEHNAGARKSSRGKSKDLSIVPPALQSLIY